jgi:hypothetical protein
MAQLTQDFINHYTELSKTHNFRDHYNKSWAGIDRAAEVPAIRSYLLEPDVGVSYLNKTVASKLSGGKFNVKFASLFCHKKPGVKRTQANQNNKPGERPGCELGDLFVLFLLLDGQDQLHYASGSIFQAKVEPKLDSLTQQLLYDEDDSFEVPSYLENRVGSAGINRKMPSYIEGRAKAFRYLILDPTNTTVKAKYTPWSNSIGREWSPYMDGLMSGVDGLSTVPSVVASNAWDTVVADLLYVGLKVSKTKGKSPRGNTIAVQVATSLFNHFNNTSNFSHQADDSYEGVPTLMVIAHAPDHNDVPPGVIHD